MSFGFSVGDFLAVGQLTADVISCLRDVRGSKSEYQALILELECLQATFVRLDTIPTSKWSVALESVKFTALSCRRPLETFLARIKKFERSLGPWAKEGGIRSAVDKVKFALRHEDEIQKFQSYLHIHIHTINLLLTEHGLAELDLHKHEILDKIDASQSALAKIRDSSTSQTETVLRTESLTNRLLAMIEGDVVSPLSSLQSVVSQVCVSIQKLYTAVLEIRSNMISTDARWSFFQAPCRFEDALGRITPVPSEYDLDLLHTIIRHRFQTGPGALEVKKGSYDIFYTNNIHKSLPVGAMLTPGRTIKMAIKLPQAFKLFMSGQACPMPRCTSRTSDPAPWGGRICCSCDVWFDPTYSQNVFSFTELRLVGGLMDIVISPHSPLSEPESTSSMVDDPVCLRSPQANQCQALARVACATTRMILRWLAVPERIQVDPIDDAWDSFRNVRCSPESFLMPSFEVLGRTWEIAWPHRKRNNLMEYTAYTDAPYPSLGFELAARYELTPTIQSNAINTSGQAFNQVLSSKVRLGKSAVGMTT
ncbi:hypothetical protein F5Y16DRAFT_73753 [Xylariaceae sp. FL0255]|nr:hypothetical protein F5Y16DRAFT_73753 [Xylariaceae sp. FL0255]